MWLDSSYIVLNSLLTELYGEVKGQASFFISSLKLLGPKKSAAIKVLITMGKQLKKIQKLYECNAKIFWKPFLF